MFHIPSTIRTSFGPAFVPTRAHVRVTLTTAELFSLIGHIQREAEQARADGQHDLAERLDWRAADLKEAGR